MENPASGSGPEIGRENSKKLLISIHRGYVRLASSTFLMLAYAPKDVVSIPFIDPR